MSDNDDKETTMTDYETTQMAAYKAAIAEFADQIREDRATLRALNPRTVWPDAS